MTETTSTPTATQERIDLEVTGMTCASCAARIEKIHARELPILGKSRKGTSLSEAQQGRQHKEA